MAKMCEFKIFKTHLRLIYNAAKTTRYATVYIPAIKSYRSAKKISKNAKTSTTLKHIAKQI